VEHLHEDKM